jgi:hypothetical protein
MSIYRRNRRILAAAAAIIILAVVLWRPYVGWTTSERLDFWVAAGTIALAVTPNRDDRCPCCGRPRGYETAARPYFR